MKETIVGYNEIIRQSNHLTEASFDLSPIESNVFFTILAQIRPDSQPHEYYYVSIADVIKYSRSALTYNDVYTAIKRMVGLQVEFRNSETGNPVTATLVSSIEELWGRGLVEVYLDPKIRPYLFNLKKQFTEFQFAVAMRLKGKYSKRFYMLFCRHLFQQEVTINLLELKQMFKLYDEKSRQEKYPVFKDFKKRVLDSAIQEINSRATELEVEYTENRDGRKVESITFRIKESSNHAVQQLISFSDGAQVVANRLRNEFGLSTVQVAAVLDNHSLSRINEALYEINLKVVNKEIDKKKVGGYTAKVFNVSGARRIALLPSETVKSKPKRPRKPSEGGKSLR